MKLINSFPAFISLISCAVLLVACASPTAPDGAAQARAKLTQLQSDQRLANLAPVAIEEADAAVKAAEKPREDKSLASHLVYVAERKVDKAQALAQARYLEDERKNISDKATSAQLDARTREADASKREAEALRREIAELNAKETERGLVVTLGDVLFETGKSELRGGASANLSKLVGFLAQQPDRSLVIEGHTDNVGSDSSNQVLSQNRADSVKVYLIRQGVAANRITAIGKGESVPVASNDSATGRQMNRRVEIVIAN